MASNHHRSVLRGQCVVGPRGSSKCLSHRQNDVIFVCQDCNEALICATCSTTTHGQHNLIELSDRAKLKKRTLTEFEYETDDRKLPEIKEQIQSAKKELNDNDSHFQQLTSKMKQQAEKGKKEIDLPCPAAERVFICDEMKVRMEISQNVSNNWKKSMKL